MSSCQSLVQWERRFNKLWMTRSNKDYSFWTTTKRQFPYQRISSLCKNMSSSRIYFKASSIATSWLYRPSCVCTKITFSWTKRNYARKTTLLFRRSIGSNALSSWIHAILKLYILLLADLAKLELAMSHNTKVKKVNKSNSYKANQNIRRTWWSTWT